MEVSSVEARQSAALVVLGNALTGKPLGLCNLIMGHKLGSSISKACCSEVLAPIVLR